MTILWWEYLAMGMVWAVLGLVILSLLVGVMKQALVSGACTVLQEHMRLRKEFLKEFDSQMSEERLGNRTNRSAYN